MIDVILGLQWGDEGKGKIVDYFAPNYQVIARFQGGPNAGHTIYPKGEKVVLHQVPSGIFHDHTKNLIGNGVVLDVITLRKEIQRVLEMGGNTSNLFISKRAHLIIPTHRALDKASELQKGDAKIGSTLKGIGPTYMDKTGRNGLRVGDLFEKGFTTKYIKLRMKHQRLLDSFSFNEDISEWEEEFLEALEFFRSLNIVDGEYFMQEELAAGKNILAEGAQGSMLDIDFGTFPFVTSSNTISAGVMSGLGVAPQKIREVIGITKAYCTRVGSGPFPTELDNEEGEKLRKAGNEFGATTGRPRRCGWIDLVALQYACMINGVTKMVMTKADVLDGFKELKACTSYNIEGKSVNHIPFQMSGMEIEPEYRVFEGWNQDSQKFINAEDLPESMTSYLKFVNESCGAPVNWLSNGPERDQIIPL